MTLARQIFTIVPAQGRASLDAGQRQLLTGKAHWLYLTHEAGLPAIPTIGLTRAAWEALAEIPDTTLNRLHRIWIATLFRLVPRGQKPPDLVVRTTAAHHSPGLMPAKIGISAPRDVAEATDRTRPLARAIDAAFASYAATGPLWASAEPEAGRAEEIVIIQPVVTGPMFVLQTRDPKTGVLGPDEEVAGSLGPARSSAEALIDRLDRESGRHMKCLVAPSGSSARLVSARPFEAGAAAELAAAVDRVGHQVWTPHQAVLSFDPERLPQLLHARLVPGDGPQPLARGLGVSPGAATGQIVFSAEDAVRLAARNQPAILVAPETGPADIDGMKAAAGIITARGGPNSHAAIIARVSGKPCVGGLRDLKIEPDHARCQIGGWPLAEGDEITVDGGDGAVYAGRLPLTEPQIGGGLARLLDWSDASRTIAVRTNVETADAARTALAFGAEGIGLARSEHMFFTHERLAALRRMILSQNETDRIEALKGLVDYQRGDYAELFRIMAGKPVTVRLFDPPLHEFLPRSPEDIAETATALKLDPTALRQRLERLAELNPMLGHRGCRLAVTYPEILDMQIKALVAGVRDAAKTVRAPIALEIMVPFVTTQREVAWMRRQVFTMAEREGLLDMDNVRLSFGTMIELPRAALRADDIAPYVDFFSFGTNDLTQSTFGISRDDSPAFMSAYLRRGLYDADPFISIDQRGVGELIELAIARGRSTNPHLKIGICGEHAGDPASLKFFAELGVDYVSCSPYRVPVARLALGQSQRRAG